jgi:predicted nucleic acid-binding protein
MAERVVVDASLAILLLIPEPARPIVRGLVGRWTEAGAELIVPSHFWLEVTNVLSRRYRRPPQATIEDLILLDGLGLRTMESDRPLLLLAIDAMARHELTAYDALYLALAQSTDAALATLDRRLASAAVAAGARVEPAGDARLAEDRAVYAASHAAEPVWLRSAAVGQHIAELRRQLRDYDESTLAGVESGRRVAKRYRRALRELAR